MKSLLLTCAFFMFQIAVFAGPYKLYAEQDGIKVYGKWKYEKPFKKGQLVLCLKVENTTSEMKTYGFDIVFYDVAVAKESKNISPQCIAAGSALQGKKYGFCIISSAFSNEALLKDEFHWKIESLEISSGCNPSSE